MDPRNIVVFFLSMESCAGLLLNVYLVVVNVRAWAKVRRLSSGDQILLAYGASNTVWQCILINNDIIYLFWYHVYLSEKVYPVMIFLYFNFSISSSWMTTFLCSFYCIKVVRLQHPFFAFLKARFSKMMPWLILLSLVGSTCFSSLMFTLVYKESALNNTTNYTLDATGSNHSVSRQIFTGILLSVACFIPFLLGVFALVLTLISLIVHVHNMQKNTWDFSSPHLQAYVGTVRTMSLLLLLYLFYFLSQLFLSFSIFSTSSPWFWMCLTIQHSYLPLQSLLLIQQNPKFR
ncbi:hypothetical protein FKM82_029045, partial [Ascaphus truei]